MTSGLGKVSFSFSKTTKRPVLQSQPTETVKKVDKIEYINSIEDNSVQVINPDSSNEKGPLIIPLLHPNLLIQSVIDTVKSRAKTEVEEGERDGNQSENISNENEEKTEIKRETLDEMAAREILEDASKEVAKKPESSDFVVPLVADTADRKESTLDDYDNIPVGDFGLAMLRGMGWDPKKGIGKNGQIVKVTGPTLRPKGLGLGADKAIAAQKPVGKNVSEKAVLSKGCKVRVTFGQYKNLYGTVEGFDDDAGRVNVFMALSNERVSMNECFVQLVTLEEFSKYSKVININAYNNYKDKESGKPESKNIENDQEISSSGHKDEVSGRDGRISSSSYKNDRKDGKCSQSSSRHKSYKHKSDSEDSDSKHSNRRSKNGSSNDRERRKRYDSSGSDGCERRHSKSKSSSRHSKYSKRRSTDSDNDSEYGERKVKSRSKDSRQDKHRRKSSDSDRERRRKHKKSGKRRDRSRLRSGR